MNAAVILGPANVAKPLAAFQRAAHAQWTSLIERRCHCIFGGDGTIHRNLSTPVDLGVPLMVVPFGRWKRFRALLGLHTAGELTLRMAKVRLFGAGNVRSIDLE